MNEQIEASDRPWVELVEMLDRDASAEVERFLASLGTNDLIRCIDRLDAAHRDRVLELLESETAAELIEQLPSVQGGEMLQNAAPGTAAAILEELDSDDQADLLTTFEPENAASILAEMKPGSARDAAQLATYASDTAGGLMMTEFLAYRRSMSVAELVADLRRRVEEIAYQEIQYIYVVDEQQRLKGVLPLRELLLAPGSRTVDRVMIADPISVDVGTRLEELIELFDRRPFLGFPVVDAAGVMRGILHRTAAENAWGDRAESDRLKGMGIVGGEELRSMPVWLRARRRLSWLSVNILLNLLAASVIAAYQDTLSAVIALAVFLPIISDMSGCSGNQAVAVSMRELTLGVIKPIDLFYVWRKEILVGLINGGALGVLLGAAAWAWKGNPTLGLIVGGALALNTLLAVSIGGGVPLILRRLGKDPALASGPILTTLTDMCGFFLALSFATAALDSLQ
jgi:magnesium transporter